MKIILSNVIEIENPTKEIKDYCIKNLTFDNPDYIKRKSMNFWTGNIPKTIKLYNLYNNNLYIPSGMFNELWKIHPIKDDYIDYTVTIPIKCTSNIKLRDYQEPVVQAVKDNYCGIICEPCGMGKTCSLIHTICEIKQKTLWIAGTIDLINQAKETAERLTSLKVSFISEGKCDTSGELVCATPQSIIKFIENGTLKPNMFGCVIQDETHHVCTNPKSMQMFRTCIEFFASRYRIGCTATVWRSDGLEGCILKIMGNIIYNIVQNKKNYDCVYNDKVILSLPMDKFQVPCHVIVKKTDYNVEGKDVFDPNGGTIIYARLITDIAMDKERNDLIINDLKHMQGSTIVLSDRVEQLKYISERVENSVVVTGNTPKKEREQSLNNMRIGKIKVLCSTFQLAKEGLDIPILGNLVIATPTKTFSTVQQSVGRIQRPYEGKKIAYVFDYVDDVGMAYRYFQKRRAIYRKNNWEIDNLFLGGK